MRKNQVFKCTVSIYFHIETLDKIKFHFPQLPGTKPIITKYEIGKWNNKNYHDIKLSFYGERKRRNNKEIKSFVEDFVKDQYGNCEWFNVSIRTNTEEIEKFCRRYRKLHRIYKKTISKQVFEWRTNFKIQPMNDKLMNRFLERAS